MKPLAALLAVLLASGASAQTTSLRGQWDTSLPSDPEYAGILLIDAEHRATFEANSKYGRNSLRGFVKVESPSVEIVFTDGGSVGRLICRIRSIDDLECRGVQADGRFTVTMALKRVGPGPHSLMPASR